jgi:hypothetical protein
VFNRDVVTKRSSLARRSGLFRGRLSSAVSRYRCAVRPHRHPQQPPRDYSGHGGSARSLFRQQPAVPDLQSHYDIGVVEREKGAAIAQRVQPADVA